MTMRVDFGIISVYLILVIVGIGYNALVAWIERNGYQHGYTSILVIGGVLITLTGVAVIDVRAALVCLGAFAATGLPMVIGSIWREVRLREEIIKQIKEVGHDDAA